MTSSVMDNQRPVRQERVSPTPSSTPWRSGWNASRYAALPPTSQRPCSRSAGGAAPCPISIPGMPTRSWATLAFGLGERTASTARPTERTTPHAARTARAPVQRTWTTARAPRAAVHAVRAAVGPARAAVQAVRVAGGAAQEAVGAVQGAVGAVRATAGAARAVVRAVRMAARAVRVAVGAVRPGV